MRPYKIVGVVSGLTSVFAFSGAVLYPILLPFGRALALSIASGFLVWALAGTVDLVLRTAWHGTWRSRVPEIREAGAKALEERRRRKASGSDG
jgi:hypothetical protein